MPHRPSFLGSASDWKLLVDFDKKKILFPAQIAPTNERPDIVIWSDPLRVVLLAELNCPPEEGIVEASMRKQARYLDLKTEIETVKRKYRWTAHLITIPRGFVANSMFSFLKKLGLSN